jgi:hypothetical protein
VSDGTTFFKIWAANAWAYELDLGKAERVVLLALIFHANPETWLCRPRQARLAEMTGWSKRSVWAVLASLEEQGLISRFPRWRDDGTHRREVDLTRVNLPAEVASRYRRNAWEAPDEEMISPAEWLFPETDSSGVRADLLAPVAKERSTSTPTREEIKRSLARAASRSAENGHLDGIDQVLEEKPGR